MKYVIAETLSDGIVSIMFPNHLDHDKMAERIPGYIKAKGAGFVQLVTDKEGYPAPHCFGKSISLNVSSRPEDSAYIRKELERGSW